MNGPTYCIMCMANEKYNRGILEDEFKCPLRYQFTTLARDPRHAWSHSWLGVFLNKYQQKPPFCHASKKLLMWVQVVIDLRLTLQPAGRQFRPKPPGAVWSCSHSHMQLETGKVRHTSSVSVCLGIFSSTSHPPRCLPRKNSLYLLLPAKMERKALISTQKWWWLDSMTEERKWIWLHVIWSYRTLMCQPLWRIKKGFVNLCKFLHPCNQ